MGKRTVVFAVCLIGAAYLTNVARSEAAALGLTALDVAILGVAAGTLVGRRV